MAIRKTVIKRYESQDWVDNYPVTAWAYIENIPSTFPPSAHTHNYAGSSSAGGDANNAVKLNGQAASYYLNYNNFINTPTIPTKASWNYDDRYVRYDTNSQGLNDTQKANARTNIGAGTSNFTGYTSSNKLSASYISGLATVATSGSYNDLSNKPTIPTKTSQLTNDSGYLTSSTLTGDVVIDALGYTPGTYNKPSGGIPASDLAQTYYLASNPNGYTSNIGTVTTVKLGSTSYSPSSGVISLPAYPTTLPASDVYSWAKAATKPSYTYSEVGAAAASHTHTTIVGSYTANGGQQNPNYFGTNKVGALMMNTPVNSNSQYKDWLIMDCYSGSDVGGAVAIGINRQSLGLYIMRSAAARSSWAESAELIGTHNINTYLSGYATQTWVNNKGYITGITSSMVTNALGYTPYNSSNPNGYTSNTGTVTSVAVKMNGSVKGTITTSGTIDLGTVITSHQDISGKADKASMTAGWYRRVYVNTQGIVTEGDQGDTDTNTWRKIQLNGVDKLGNATSTNPLNIKNGSGITITESSGAFTFALNLTGDLVVDALGYTPGTSNFSGSYNDLSNKPTIPTKVSQLTNDSGYITGITSSMVTTALGYTPASSSHTHNYIITTGDNRSVATKPNDYNNMFRFQGLKTNTVIGSPSSDTYSYVVGLRGWSDSSGGNSWELAFTNTAIFVRNGATTSWGSWYRLAYKSEIPTYTSQLTNDSGFITSITSSMVTTALGYTPLSTTGTAADSSKLNGQAASYYLNYNNLSNKPTIYTDCVRYVSQSLTDAQKTQARSNIGAGTSSFTGYTSSNKLSTSYISGLATVATSGSYNDLSNKPTIPNVPSWALQSTKPSYDASEISCDAFGDDLSSILQAMDSAIAGKAASSHTHDTRYVRFDTASQGLTTTQKSNARTNIGAGTGNGTVTSVSVKINGTVKGTVTTSGTIDLGTIGGGGVEIGFVGYLYFNDDKNTPVWFEISAAGYGLSEGLYIVAPEDSYPGYQSNNARYWQGCVSRLSATEGSFKLWKTRNNNSAGYVQFTYSSPTSVTITASDCAADYGKFIIYKLMNVDEP